MHASLKVALATILCGYVFISCGGGGEAYITPTCIMHSNCDPGYVCYELHCVEENSVDPNLLDPCMTCKQEEDCVQNRCLSKCKDTEYRNDKFECVEYDCHDKKPCPQSWEKCETNHKCVDTRECNNDGRNCDVGFICTSKWQCDDVRECHSGNPCPTPQVCNSQNFRCEAECITVAQCPGQYDQCINSKCTDSRECTDTGKNCDPGFVCNHSSWKCDDIRECHSGKSCPSGFECNSDFKCEDKRECLSDNGCPIGFKCDVSGTWKCIDRRECHSALPCPEPWQACSPSTMTCIDTRECHGAKPCSTGFRCDNNYKCIENECNDTDKECAEGKKCVFGQCAAIVSEDVCTTACADDRYQCIEQRCILKESNPFVMTVSVLKPGIAQFDAYYGRYSYPTEQHYANNDVFIDCGGGKPLYHNYSDPTKYLGHACEYEKAGTYTIRLYGQIDHLALCILMKDTDINGKTIVPNYAIQSVDQWGDSRWKSLENMFDGCRNVIIKDTDAPDFRLVSLADEMFNESNKVTIPGNLFDRTAQPLRFTGMFMSAIHISSGISQWKTNRVTDMKSMFYKSDFNGDLSKWDVSRVTDMSKMFYGAEKFSGCNALNNWDLSNLVSASKMFEESGLSCVPSWCLPQLSNYDNMFGGLVQCVLLRSYISCLPPEISAGALGCW